MIRARVIIQSHKPHSGELLKSMAAHHACSIEVLPRALHLSIVLQLSLLERVRCALVSKAWKALLDEPTFWAHLEFEGVAPNAVNDATLLALCKRSHGTLRLLDVTSCGPLYLSVLPKPAGAAQDGLGQEPLLAQLSREGLCGQLQTLIHWKPWVQGGRTAFDDDDPFGPQEDNNRNVTERDAAALLAACPALSSVSLSLEGSLPGVAGALRVLPAAGRKSVWAVLDEPPPQVGGSAWSADHACATADAVISLLASGAVEDLCLEFQNLYDSFADEEADYSGGGAELTAEHRRALAAQDRLAAALSHPTTGPRSLKFRGEAPNVGKGVTVLASLLRSLTPESRLTKLSLDGIRYSWSDLDGDTLRALAAALAPGRARIETLRLSMCLLPEEGDQIMDECVCDEPRPRDATPAV